MVTRSKNGLDMDAEVSHDESSSDEESEVSDEEEADQVSDEEEADAEDSDAGEDSPDEDDPEDVVEIKGTKFNVKEVSKDANVEDSEDETDNDEDANDEENQSPAEEEDEAGSGGRSGWADAMAKVLNMGKDSEQTPGLLSKAKLDNFQVKVEERVEPRDAVKRLIKKEMEEKGRVKPNVVRDRAKEKLLSKLATRGVVQLFNAVKEQQKDIKSQLDQVGGSVRKREKVYKNIDKEGFLQVLSSAPGGREPTKKKARSAAREEGATDAAAGWGVIRDDYMLGAKMKDWDKESDNEEVAS